MTGGTAVPARLLDSLNQQQRQAVLALDGPLLVVAGPGSGKTRVLTHRVAALVATGLPPEAILALTFTNKAADEMRTRIASLVSPEEASKLWVSTFHSFCLRLLRATPTAGGLPPSFTIVDAKDALRLVKAVTVELGFSPDDAAMFHNRISFAKNHMRGIDDLDPDLRSDRDLASVWEAYQDRLETIAGVDFDDLLLRALRALRDPDVLYQVRGRFRRVLVDEWQDTNRVQYEIVAAITAVSHQLAVVGDAQQAIYAWRGSTPEVLEAFTTDYPEAKVVTLDRNYRSTPQILEVAQRIIDESPSRFATSLWTENVKGSPVRIYAATDTDDEARWVIEDMAKQSGTIAVLVRTNAQTRAFEHELAASGIPYQMVGATRFYDRAEVRDAIAYLRLVVNPADAVALERASMTPRRGVGARTVEVFMAACRDAQAAPGEAMFDEQLVASLGGRSGPAIRRLADDMAKIRSAASGGIVDTLATILDDVGLYAFYAGKDEDRAANLDALREAADTFTAHTSTSGSEQVRRFVELATLVSAADNDEGKRVSLITAHAAKGREFDHVYVVGVERDLFPHWRAISDGELDEERRLFFVAVTRARAALTLSFRRRRFLNGSWEDAIPSPFLDAISSPEVVRLSSPARMFGTSFRPSQKRQTTRSHTRSGSATQSRGTTAKRRAMRQPTPPKVDAAAIQVGCTVSHPVFGSGTVTSRSTDTVTVAFEDRERKLTLQWAPLTLLE